MDLIILNTSRYGGICDYLHCQANAMTDLGANVAMVGVAGNEKSSNASYEFIELWKEPRVVSNRLVRRLLFAGNLVGNARSFARFVQSRPERIVLFGGYFEYLAPFWCRPFRKLSQQGWNIGSIIHDPVRDYVVGPGWWHNRSIRAAFSFLDLGFVHGPTSVVEDAGDAQLISLPIGPFPFPDHKRTGRQLRDEMGIPNESTVVLSFGHIRDGKNLDLLIKAIAGNPDLHLIVAGSEQSSGQKPAAHYQSLAKKLGAGERCHFETRFINDEEVGTFHEAADLIALTYSSDFRSASAALSTCIHYQKPCIASSGPGPLKESIERYEFGVWVEPDSAAHIEAGISQLLNKPLSPDWNRFSVENSWRQNASIVLDAFRRLD